MDADRLPIAVQPVRQDLVQPVTPEYEMEKQNFQSEDKKEENGYHQATLDVHDIDEHYIPGDPLPFDPSLPEETAQFTFRAVLVGCALGAVVQASNLYLGLKTGFTFGPQLLGGIGGFIILKGLSRIIPNVLPAWFGSGYFGPKENVTCQSAATAAGGLGILFVSGFPAMYQLGLLSPLPQNDFGKLVGYMLSVAFYGMSFAVPLRAFYILRQRLVFPTPSATAYAIRSLHAPKTGAAEAKTKGRWLFYSFLVCFIQKIASTYAPGLLYDWHVFYWLAALGAPKAQLLDNWAWWFEWTPAFFGAGILSGVNASLSFFGGFVLAWGIIGPALVATGRAVGVDISEDATDGDRIPYYRNYFSMSPKNPSSTATSPRYNLLWIGVLVMLVSAFVELAVEWRTIAAGIAPMINGVRNKFRARRGKELIKADVDAPIVDPAPLKDQVRWFIWVPVTVVGIAITCIVQGVAFGVNVGLSILAIILAFLFSFIGVLSAGVTDVNPVSTCAKATQLVVGGATHGQYTDSINPTTGYNIHAIRVNLLCGMVSAGAAAQATDLTGDLKTGHLVGAKPVTQYFAQLIGAFVSCFLSVAFFVLFTTASPCIIQIGAKSCPYGVPSAAAWRSVAIAITATDGLPVPTTSGILAICLTALAVAIILARTYLVPPKYKQYMPNPSAAGLAFVIYQTFYGTAMAVGALGGYWWKRKNPSSYERLAFVFAAGMITGEGLGGVAQAILTIAGAGPDVGSQVGCPGTGC